MRGERTADQRVDDPALRHPVATANGKVVVQETSGTAFAEATRAENDDRDASDAIDHAGAPRDEGP